jgi:hypothetical protein
MSTPRFSFVHVQSAAPWRKEKNHDRYVDPINGEVSYVSDDKGITDPAHWIDAPKTVKARPSSPFKRCLKGDVTVERVSRKKIVKPL